MRAGGRRARASPLRSLRCGLVVVAGLEGGPGISDTGVYQSYGEQIAAASSRTATSRSSIRRERSLPFVAARARLVETHDGYDAAFRALMMSRSPPSRC